MIKTVTYKFEAYDVKRFQTMIHKHGISQERIAQETGMKQSEVSNCILGKRTLTPSLCKWCKMYGFDIEPHEMTVEEALDMVEDSKALRILQKALGINK